MAAGRGRPVGETGHQWRQQRRIPDATLATRQCQRLAAAVAIAVAVVVADGRPPCGHCRTRGSVARGRERACAGLVCRLLLHVPWLQRCRVEAAAVASVCQTHPIPLLGCASTQLVREDQTYTAGETGGGVLMARATECGIWGGGGGGQALLLLLISRSHHSDLMVDFTARPSQLPPSDESDCTSNRPSGG